MAFRLLRSTSGILEVRMRDRHGRLSLRLAPLRAAPRLGVLALVIVCAPLAAHAQDRLDLQIFRPAMDSKGYVTLNGSQVLGPGDVSFGLVTTWGRGVLRSGTTEIDNLLAPQLQA